MLHRSQIGGTEETSVAENSYITADLSETSSGASLIYFSAQHWNYKIIETSRPVYFLFGI